MNRNKSLDPRNHNNRRINQNDMKNEKMGLMRMSEFEDFDRMFQDFGMPGFGGIDDFFSGGIKSRFDELERNMFTK